jgi:adenylate cyclase
LMALSTGTVDLILREATAGDSLADLLTTLCERLVADGLPLWRFSVSMPAIDPTVRALGFVWRRDLGVEAAASPHGSQGEAMFQRSPISHLQAHNLERQRWLLEDGEGCDTFPILEELRAEGATD